MLLPVQLNTNGKGLWSSEIKAVEVTFVTLRTNPWDKEFSDFGELRVFFTKDTWDTDKDGLIYTDPLWLKELKVTLEAEGFTKKALKEVDYSEQGMQGDDYVSLDVGKQFIKQYKKLNQEK